MYLFDQNQKIGKSKKRKPKSIQMLFLFSVWMVLFLLSTKLATSRSFVLETTKNNKNLFEQAGLVVTRRTRRRMTRSLSMAAKPVHDTADTHSASIDDDDDDGPSHLPGRFSLSNRIVGTLDPCVVKTKEWMGNYAHLWEGDRGGIYSLAQGVVYWKPPPSCRKALVDAVNANNDKEESEESDPLALHSYSPASGLPELLEGLKKKIEIEHGMSDHDVTVTVGANQAYTNVVLTLLGSNSEANSNRAIVFAPYYFNHVMAIQMCAGPEAVVVGPTNMDTGVPDIEWLRGTLSKHQNEDTNGIRMVTLVNPGNPTGVALSREIVKDVVDLCRNHGVWVVLDCTYEHFFNTGGRDAGNNTEQNPLPTFPDEPHVIHVFSFSKGYAMAGYRCGYLVTHKNDASKGGFLSQMLKVQDTIPIGPPRLSQHVAIGALKQGAVEDSSSSSLYCPSSKEWVYQKYATLKQSRNYILDALSSLPQQIGGSGSMYVMGKLPENLRLADDGESDQNEPVDVLFCRLLVKDYGIAIIPGSFCGSKGWIRICYANLPPGKTKEASERLRKGIKDLTGQS